MLRQVQGGSLSPAPPRFWAQGVPWARTCQTSRACSQRVWPGPRGSPRNSGSEDACEAARGLGDVGHWRRRSVSEGRRWALGEGIACPAGAHRSQEMATAGTLRATQGSRARASRGTFPGVDSSPPLVARGAWARCAQPTGVETRPGVYSPRSLTWVTLTADGSRGPKSR